MISRSRHYGRLAFMSVVTACLLAFVFSQAAKGPAGLPAVVVYSFAAGFGLEFVCAGWTGRGRSPERRSSLRR
ncbi:MAG: hypothetical protein ACR2LA_06850 [Acidimicrobiales bacterium]